MKKCFRAKVFQLAQQFRGHLTSSVNGIGIEGLDIVVDVCFKDEPGLLDFQGALINQCGRKRRLDDNDEPYSYSIINEVISRLYFYQNLVRILGNDYMHHHADNDDDANNSPLCDSEGDSLSIYSAELANIYEAEVRVQMLENHNAYHLFGQDPEVCHIKDKASCNKSKKEATDTNNHLYMSRLLHQHFDGIETTPKKTPSFIVRYLSHEDALVDCPIWDNAHVLNPAVKRQKVTVEIVFRDKAYCDNLQIYLRNGSIRTGDCVFRMDLYFEDANKARKYLLWKAAMSLRKWSDVDILCPS